MRERAAGNRSSQTHFVPYKKLSTDYVFHKSSHLLSVGRERKRLLLFSLPTVARSLSLLLFCPLTAAVTVALDPSPIFSVPARP